MTETELYRELSALTRNRNEWKAKIPTVSSLLASDSVKIRAKALWLLGEMGLQYPESIAEHVPAVAAFLDSAEPLLRERALNALGRIGRSSWRAVEPYWERMFAFAADEAASVRLSFIWASENIAANTPEPYGEHMAAFADLLRDPDSRVRMEAPEIFRVLGKRRPAFVLPYIGLLHTVAKPTRIVSCGSTVPARSGRREDTVSRIFEEISKSPLTNSRKGDII